MINSGQEALRGELEAGNAMKRLLAKAMLDNEALEDLVRKMVTPSARREAALEALLDYDRHLSGSHSGNAGRTAPQR